jgi:hypothetical protein
LEQMEFIVRGENCFPTIIQSLRTEQAAGDDLYTRFCAI